MYNRIVMIKEAADRIRRKQSKLKQELHLRRVRAQARGREIASLLGADDPTLEKVIGFGSTYETWRHFRIDSDIDLAIIGGDWFYLSRRIPLGEFHITLVELDLQNPEFKEYVLEHGEVLYEKR